MQNEHNKSASPGKGGALCTLFAVDIDGLCGKRRRAFAAGFVNVGLEAFIGRIHLAETAKNRFGALVVVGGNMLLQLTHPQQMLPLPTLPLRRTKAQRRKKSLS